jgi:hypothetical protein
MVIDYCYSKITVTTSKFISDIAVTEDDVYFHCLAEPDYTTATAGI